MIRALLSHRQPIKLQKVSKLFYIWKKLQVFRFHEIKLLSNPIKRFDSLALFSSFFVLWPFVYHWLLLLILISLFISIYAKCDVDAHVPFHNLHRLVGSLPSSTIIARFLNLWWLIETIRSIRIVMIPFCRGWSWITLWFNGISK